MMDEFVIPNRPSRCTWHKESNSSTSPHSKVPPAPRKKIMPDILHAIGHTPLVRLNKIPQSAGIKCEILVKCEFLNPGGSIKDRIGYRMVEDAEKAGILKPDTTIIEATSGNTGIGLALASAIKGYRCVIVIPEKMSKEKEDVLKALGAEIIRTPDNYIALSQRLQTQIPNSVILNQYNNPSNPLAHYDSTAAEIFEQCDGQVDMVVDCVGTGGAITGIGRRLKELRPSCKIIGVDPEGSILAQPESLNEDPGKQRELEDIGLYFVPTVLDRSIVDQWFKVSDLTALPMAKRLIKEEGLLCGGTGGAAVAVALKAAADLREDQRCVVILSDGIRNYLTKFVADQWMEVRNLQSTVNILNHWWWDEKVSALNLDSPISIPPTTSCSKALNLMKKSGLNQIPVVTKCGKLEGIGTLTQLTKNFFAAKVKEECPITKACVTKFIKVTKDTHLGLVSRALEIEEFVVVTEDKNANEEPIGLITHTDLLPYIMSNNKTVCEKQCA